MSLRVKVVALAVASLLSTSILLAQAPPTGPVRNFITDGSLTVTVHDGKNAPVADAHVDVRCSMGNQGSVSGYTNRAGMFEASGVPNGTCEIVVQKGLDQVTERTDVGAGVGMVLVRLDANERADAEAGNNATVSLAQYKVPKKARDQFNKAREAVDARKLNDAGKYLAKALEIHPEYAEALTLRGLMKLEAKQTDAALEDFDHAIKADGAYSFAYLAMGAAYNSAQKFDDALRVLDRGVALAPQSWQGYFEIGKAQIGKGEYAASIRALDKAQEMSANKYPLVHLVKAHAMLALKQYPDAMGELQAFVDQAPMAPQVGAARETLEQVKAFVAQK